jgi:hypothetical protein
MAAYTGSQMWQEDLDRAREHWVVLDDERVPLADGREIVHVRAEADTGSSYVVVVTPTGEIGRGRLGGPMLVTVYFPWQDAWSLQADGTLTSSYVAQHLSGDRHRLGHLNGGDLAALTLTVAYALGRKAVFNA